MKQTFDWQHAVLLVVFVGGVALGGWPLAVMLFSGFKSGAPAWPLVVGFLTLIPTAIAAYRKLPVGATIAQVLEAGEEVGKEEVPPTTTPPAPPEPPPAPPAA